MSENPDYPEPVRTEWGSFALLSEVDQDDPDRPDPDDYYDIHGYVQDEENWRALQRKILEEGPYDERPAAAPFDGAKYHATDVNVVFQWVDEEDRWIPLNSGTPDRPVPGTTYLEEASAGDLSYSNGTQTVHLSEDGDDVNSGENPDDAVATLGAAFDALTKTPIARSYVTHTIQVPAGETIVIDEYPQLTESYRPYVRIQSDPDAPATLDIRSGNSVGIGVYNGAKLEFRNIRVDSTRNPPDRMIRASEGSTLYLRDNTYVSGATGRQVDVRANSYVNVMSDVVIEGDGRNSRASGLSTHSASFGKMAGTIKNCNVGLFATRNGLMSATGTIDRCGTGVSTRDGPQFKLLRTTITNCDVGVSAGRDSLISCIEVTWDGNSTRKKTRDATGKVRETAVQGESGETWFGIPTDEDLVFRDENGTRIAWFDGESFNVNPYTAGPTELGTEARVTSHGTGGESRVVFNTNEGEDSRLIFARAGDSRYHIKDHALSGALQIYSSVSGEYLLSLGDGIEMHRQETTGVVWESGTTRPIDPVEGERFFDSELGRPIWYDGTDWVDANGDPV